MVDTKARDLRGAQLIDKKVCTAEGPRNAGSNQRSRFSSGFAEVLGFMHPELPQYLLGMRAQRRTGRMHTAGCF